jgi:hypothetical protein
LSSPNKAGNGMKNLQPFEDFLSTFTKNMSHHVL